MQIKNNYDIYWERKIINSKTRNEEYETGNGVFNGEIGKIIKINEKEKVVQIKFDDEKECWYEFSELEQIEHSYSITIHKAQGSEFDVVIMVVPPTAPMLLTRNLLYTGITRAKKMLIIISSPKVIEYMIQNVDSKKRNTGLEYKLKHIE
ncbi:MAG: ATP-binding domain-containing protein [Clostridia bacterium]|nr:ATP-binding domain-containing protein [Clostridia bacterium]